MIMTTWKCDIHWIFKTNNVYIWFSRNSTLWDLILGRQVFWLLSTSCPPYQIPWGEYGIRITTTLIKLKDRRHLGYDRIPLVIRRRETALFIELVVGSTHFIWPPPSPLWSWLWTAFASSTSGWTFLFSILLINYST